MRLHDGKEFESGKGEREREGGGREREREGERGGAKQSKALLSQLRMSLRIIVRLRARAIGKVLYARV